MNWRKPVVNLLLHATGHRAPEYFRELVECESLEIEETERRCDAKLEALLLHAHRKVPYYRKVLAECGAVRNGTVLLDRFSEVPVLTKEIIRREGENLYAQDHARRGSFENTSGGSTGEPVRFLQDRTYRHWSFALQAYFLKLQNAELGVRQMKLWGSARDVLGQKDSIGARLNNWLLNIMILNGFRMSDEVMGRYVARWNRLRPPVVAGYTSSVLELCRFVRHKGLKLHSPGVVISAAETLTENVRSFMEGVLGCTVVNQYGSREAGLIASECPAKEGLHVIALHNKLEILGDDLRPCEPGQMGNVYLTTLDNYSMPLIRYGIGDMAVPAEHDRRCCSCGIGFPMIRKVIGRHIEVFHTRDGTAVPGEFFIHFVGVVYNNNCVKRFQVVQKDYDHIVIRAVVLDAAKLAECRKDLVDAIKKVMGADCRVDFEYVDDIQPLSSGKYLYTVSEVPDRQT